VTLVILAAVIVVVVPVAASAFLWWVTHRAAKSRRRSTSRRDKADDAASRRRFLRGLGGWLQAGVRALALAGSPSAGLYVPADPETSVPAGEGGEDVVLAGSQLVLASAEGGTLVLDCLIPGDSRTPNPGAQVPFTLRARVSRLPWVDTVPPLMRSWIDTGTPTDIVLTRRGRAPLVRLRVSGSQISLRLQATGRSPDSPGRRV
jgi:hypothetical protein